MNHIGNRLFEQNIIIDTLTNQKTPINVNTQIFAWAPHKQNILACAVQNEIQLWTEKKQNEWSLAISFRCHSNPVRSIEWAPYETQLMFASIDDQGNCIIHNKSTENWDPIIQLQQKINQIAFSIKYLKFATCSDVIQIWNNYKVTQEIKIKSDKIIFTSNLLFILDNKSIYIYNSTTDKFRLRQQITETDQINQMTVSVTGTKLGLKIANITKFYAEDETNEFTPIN